MGFSSNLPSENVFYPCPFTWTLTFLKPFYIDLKQNRGYTINIVNHFGRYFSKCCYYSEIFELQCENLYFNFALDRSNFKMAVDLIEISFKRGYLGEKEFESMVEISKNLEKSNISQKACYTSIIFGLYISFNHGITPYKIRTIQSA